jgi:hypothetical protein
LPEQPPKQDTFMVIVEILVAVGLTYFLWQPVHDFFKPIVHSAIEPAAQALE